MSSNFLITKRNGLQEPYDFAKIENAIRSAFQSCGYNDIPEEVIEVLKETSFLLDNVEDIQDKVESVLYETSYKDVYNHFVTYRANHALLREIKTRTLFDSIIGVEKNDITRENGNMNSDTPAGMMMKFSSETTKPFVDRYILSPTVKKAQADNLLHIHDKDYYLTRSLTCIQHPLDKILTNGFQSGHGSARPAKRIETAAIQACISMETIQNEMHGGQAIPAFDFYMAPYVRSTYIEEVNKISQLLYDEEDKVFWDSIRNAQIDDYLVKELPHDWDHGGVPATDRIKQMAINATVKRVHQAMESFVHNMNSIHSRGGNQVVFSSINYGTDTSAEGRCVIREILKTTERGVGNNATAIFPIQIWKMKSGVSIDPGDPNYDLYQYSLKVAARRFFPNYLNLDSTFNKDDAWKLDDPRRFEHEVATMGALAGHEHLYIKINDGQPIDISIKDLFEKIKYNQNINGRPLQLWYNKEPLNNYSQERTTQTKSGLPNKSGVYSITYIPEDVTYIGSSLSISRRVAEHKCNIRKTGGIDAGAYFGDNNIDNYKFEVIELTENYKEAEKKYIEISPNINFKGNDKKYYKNITQKYKQRVYVRPNFRQDLSIPQDLIDLNLYDIKVLDRDNKWVKVKHIFKNDKHNSPFMMHIYYNEYGKEMCLTCTEDHPLWNGEKFIRADQYKIGDKVYRGDNTPFEVTDICWHWETVDSYDIGTETGSFIGSDIIMHNCRTRVYENRFGPKTSIGRGNLSFATINFPKLAIEVSIEDGYLVKDANRDIYLVNDSKNTWEDKERRLRKFMERCYEMEELAAMQLDERFQFQKEALAKQFPLLMKGMWLGSENLDPDDTIESVINQGTLAIGFIGLAEALVALTGKHHAEDPDMQQFGLALLENMKIKANDLSVRYQHNYSMFATPAEGLAGKFTMKDRNEFGIIPGVTDRDYYTNSTHVPVYYKCTAKQKAEIECPYHSLTLGGHIFYVEADYDPTKNPEAIDTINRIARDNNGGYISFNHPQGRCNHCNYESDDPTLVMGSTCPCCGREGSWDILQRITGYLVSTTDRWNHGKVAELHDRVIHN